MGSRLSPSLDFRGRKVTVMGLGVFGGGAGVTRFLVEQGAEVTVTDLRSPGELSRGLRQIEGLPVRLVLGVHRMEDFEGAELVVANPAVPPGSPYLVLAREREVPIETEVTLCFKLLPTERVIGVTGSNGKTTTSHLLHRMLEASGDTVWLGGNVGGSLLPELHRIREQDIVVLELSSFQLERTGESGLGPRVAVVTNLTPNHLDRHGNFDRYAEAKAQIFRRARNAVLNADDLESMARFKDRSPETLFFSAKRELEVGYFLKDGRIMERIRGAERPLIAIRDVRLPGTFNLENIMAACAGTRLMLEQGMIPGAACSAAARFKGVPHRLELVANRNGVRFINDSIATTPVSCMAALKALCGDIHLIAGGYDKRLPLDELGEAVASAARSVFLVGATADALEISIRRAMAASGRTSPLIRNAGRIEQAVKEAAAMAGPGSVVLLSPGFASYDQFLHFEERGECFRRCVAEL